MKINKVLPTRFSIYLFYLYPQCSAVVFEHVKLLLRKGLIWWKDCLMAAMMQSNLVAISQAEGVATGPRTVEENMAPWCTTSNCCCIAEDIYSRLVIYNWWFIDWPILDILKLGMMILYHNYNKFWKMEVKNLTCLISAVNTSRYWFSTPVIFFR